MALRLTTIFICLVLLMAGHNYAYAKEDQTDAAKADISEIQAGIMSFSDTWASGLRQAGAIAKESLSEPTHRLEVDRFIYYATLNAYDIAAGPYPGVSMLDMMVMTTLSRAISKRNMENRFGAAAKPILGVIEALEQEIWRFSEAYLDNSQRQALAELSNEWLEAHPHASSASFIRLSDFGELGRKPTLEAVVKKGGFLAPIRDAAESAAEIKALAERGMFLGIRMQELMMGRAELLALEMMSSQEVSQLLDDISGFRASSERYAVVAENLPAELETLVNATVAQVSTEREAALSQALDGLAVERRAALEQVLAGVANERQETLNQTLKGLQKERLGLLKSVAHIMYWGELEIRAAFTRMFMLAACLMMLWFGLRLTHRYWVDRIANKFTKVIGVVLLLMLITLPVMLLGHFLVGLVSPDFTEQSAFAERMDTLIEQAYVDSAKEND